MKALVTGGAGFIGSHLVDRLLRQGHYVVVLDNFSSGRRENLSLAFEHADHGACFQLLRGDIHNYLDCLHAIKGVDVVFHQAALKSVPQSMLRPHEYNRVNIDGTLNLLKAACKYGVHRFIFASSSSVYGDISEFPQKENAYPRPISPYALSKLAGEHYCRIFSSHYGLETVSLRYFNVYGPRQALDDEYAVVIPKFIDCLLSGNNPPVFGNGKQSRDFTYIDNVVAANLCAAKATGVAGRVFNIANGVDHTILQLVDELNAIIGTNIKAVHYPARAGDVFKSQADITAARNLLGYEPFIDFREGLAKTVSFFTQQLKDAGIARSA